MSPPARWRLPMPSDLVRNRGRYMQEAVPVGTGAMAAILGLDPAGRGSGVPRSGSRRRRQRGEPECAGQVVIAGAAAAVARAIERAKALGARRAIPLQVSAPFHCALMKPAEDRLAPELRALPHSDPRVPVVANVDAEPKTTAAASIEALIQQVSSPVRWEDVMRRMIADGATAFVEVGPGHGAVWASARSSRATRRFAHLDSPGDLAGVEALFAGRAMPARLQSSWEPSTGKSRSSPARPAASGVRLRSSSRARGAMVVAAARADQRAGSGRRNRGGRRQGRARDRRDDRRGVARGAGQRSRRASRQDRHARQQRRHHARSIDAAHEARGLGRGAGRPTSRPRSRCARRCSSR